MDYPGKKEHSDRTTTEKLDVVLQNTLTVENLCRSSPHLRLNFKDLPQTEKSEEEVIE